MKKRNIVIIANWKQNPETLPQARTLFRGIKTAATKLRGVETIVCPPYIYLSELSKKTKSSKLALGAQDVSPWEGGAHTGDISPSMLVKMGVKTVIIGHSERREEGESDEIINTKIKTALKYNLRIVLCVGEKVRDTDGEYFSHIRKQIERALKGVARTKIPNIIIAYEPIWAIGSQARRADTPESFIEMSIFIRKVLNERYGKSYAMKTVILYGGSVDEKNAESFLIHREVAGFLVGRASLDSEKFKQILTLANTVR